jgi:hypothetical protein
MGNRTCPLAVDQLPGARPRLGVELVSSWAQEEASRTAKGKDQFSEKLEHSQSHSLMNLLRNPRTSQLALRLIYACRGENMRKHALYSRNPTSQAYDLIRQTRVLHLKDWLPG